MTAPATTCPNCNAPRAGRYCPSCGQDNRHQRLLLTDAISDATEALFGIEGRLWRTVSRVATGPGKVARANVEGQRASYLHPMRYAFWTCAMWWGALALMFALYYPPEVSQNLAPITVHGNWLNLIMMPVIATGVWVVFLGSKRSWVDTFFTLLFACGTVFLWRSVLAIAAPLLPIGATGERAITIADSIGALLFLLWGLHGLHRGRTTWLWPRLLAAAAVLTFGSSYLIQLAVTLLGS